MTGANRRGPLPPDEPYRPGGASPASFDRWALAEVDAKDVELEVVHDRLVRLYRDYQQLFERAPVAFATLSADGAIVRMNDRARALLGDVDSPTRFEELVEVDARARVRATLERLGPELQLGQFEAKLKGPSRPRVEIGVTARRLPREPGDPEHVLLAIEDRTAFRHTQRALVQSERELRSLLNLAPDGVAIVQDGRYLYVNEAWAALMGRPRSRLGRETVFDQLEVSDRPVVEELLASPSPATLPVSVRFHSVTGSEHIVELRSMQTEYRGQAAVLLVARDLTERRRLEARMAQSERLATVGLLVAGVAHEINNPLTFVEANLDEVERRLDELDVPGVEDLRVMLAEAREGTDRVARIVADLRTFQQSKDETQLVDCNRVVADTLRMVAPKIRHRAQPDTELGELPPIVCNETRLVQVLANLITNAAEAMPSDRPVDANRITVHTWRAGPDACIKVEDNGSGIDDEAKKQVFDPFFTTRKSSGGTGLGLAIGNSLVQQMGGFISVDSAPNEGSRFVVHLPVEAGARPAIAAAPLPKAEPLAGDEADLPPEGLRVLVVDDEELTLRSLTRAIRRIGKTITAESGRAAVELLSHDDGFDVVVTDLVMGDGSGQDLIEWIRTHRPALLDRVVVMTGMTHPELDAPDWVPRMLKPFDLDELRTTIAAVARRGAHRAARA